MTKSAIEIDAHKKRTALLALARMGDQAFDSIARLDAEGFLRAQCWLKYRMEYWPTGGDVADFALECVEEVKELIGNCKGAQTLYGQEDGYRSPLFEMRRLERNARLGHPLTNRGMVSSGPESWRHWPNTWMRESERQKRLNPEAFLRTRDSFRQRLAAVRKDEAAMHSVATLIDPPEKLRLAEAILDAGLRSCGYKRDSQKGTVREPCWRHDIAGEWSLYFRILGDSLFLQNNHGQSGNLIVHCQVEHRLDFSSTPWFGERGASSGGVRKLPIKYGDAVPDFAWCYEWFDDAAQLETAVNAHVFLYKLEHDLIVKAVHASVCGAP